MEKLVEISVKISINWCRMKTTNELSSPRPLANLGFKYLHRKNISYFWEILNLSIIILTLVVYIFNTTILSWMAAWILRLLWWSRSLLQNLLLPLPGPKRYRRKTRRIWITILSWIFTRTRIFPTGKKNLFSIITGRLWDEIFRE